MGRHVYTVCTGMKLLAEGVAEQGWWIDPKTGHQLENALYIWKESPGYRPDELKGSSSRTSGTGTRPAIP